TFGSWRSQHAESARQAAASSTSRYLTVNTDKGRTSTGQTPHEGTRPPLFAGEREPLPGWSRRPPGVCVSRRGAAEDAATSGGRCVEALRAQRVTGEGVAGGEVRRVARPRQPHRDDAVARAEPDGAVGQEIRWRDVLGVEVAHQEPSLVLRRRVL